MVIRRKLVVCAFLACLVFSLSSVGAAEVSGMTSFSTGGMFAEGGFSMWYSTAQARLSVSTPVSSSVKAQISGVYTLTPGINLSTFRLEYRNTVALEKAYVRFRLPWVGDQMMRLTFGKSPLAWGYGQYFNAGDIIFGAMPNSEVSNGELLSAEYRTATAWMGHIFFPLWRYASVEFLVLPQIDEGSVIQGNFSSLGLGRLGTRLTINPGLRILDSFEFGYLGFSDGSSHALSFAMDGNIWLDYNFALSTKIVPAEADSFTTNLTISIALQKIFQIPTSTRNMPLSFRFEALLRNKTHVLNLFGVVSLGVLDSLSVSITTSYEYAKYVSSYLLIAYRPTAGLTLGIQGGIYSTPPIEGYDKRGNMGVLTVSAQYAF